MLRQSHTDLLPLSIVKNRRGSRRLRTKLRVDFCPLVTTSDGLRVGGMQRGVALDISRTGLFISNVGYLRLGATIHLFLRLPDIPANPVVCYAKVVRSERTPRVGYGIRLLRLKSGDAERLERYVARLRDANRRRPPPVPIA